MELHHIKQVAYGGEDTFENCIPLCFDCHADMGKARQILQKAFEEDSRVMKDYPVSSYVDKLDSSAVVVAAYGWLKNDDYYQTKWDLTEKIKNELDHNEISIPYDQLDVHMIQ